MAEIDRREKILARLLEIYSAIEGANGFRNRIDIHESKRPAIILLDSDETADDTADGKGRPANGPILMSMFPETHVLLGDDPADVGTTLNTFRIKVIKAVLSDQTLADLVKDGDIRYLGYQTELASGRSMEGSAGLAFQFRYMIHPSKL